MREEQTEQNRINKYNHIDRNMGVSEECAAK